MQQNHVREGGTICISVYVSWASEGEEPPLSPHQIQLLHSAIAQKRKKKKNLYVVWKFDHLSTHTNMDMYVFVRDWTVLMIYLLSLGTTLDIGNRSYLLLQLFTLKKQVFSCIAIVIFILMFQILWKHGKNVTIKLYIYIYLYLFCGNSACPWIILFELLVFS